MKQFILGHEREPGAGAPLQIPMSVPQVAEFSTPPVIETALAIEFAPISDWTSLHYGVLWQAFRTRYPFAEVHSPTILGTPIPAMDPPLRYFFLNQDKTELIQMRSGAFIRNWRAMPENGTYPSYSRIRPSFIRDFSLFMEFLRENGFPPPEVWKCEVTYVNHFVRGKEWQEFSDLGSLIPALRPLTSWNGQLSQLHISALYQLEGPGDALQVHLLPALRPDGKELLQLTLTAFGKPKSNDIMDLVGWLDTGRKSIVEAFCEFTSSEAQKRYWGKL